MKIQYSGDFPATKPLSPYTGNSSGMSANAFGDSIICFGGSWIKESMYPNYLYSDTNMVNTSQLFVFDTQSSTM